MTERGTRELLLAKYGLKQVQLFWDGLFTLDSDLAQVEIVGAFAFWLNFQWEYPTGF
jgi:hypothetical protein